MLFHPAWMLASLAMTMHGFCVNARSKLTGSSAFASASQVVSPNAISQALNTEGSPPTLMLWDACLTSAMEGHAKQLKVTMCTQEQILFVVLLLIVLPGTRAVLSSPAPHAEETADALRPSSTSTRRINKGFYQFGTTSAELDLVNHKLMARTDDGWNRGTFGPVDKFLGVYENIERERAGIPCRTALRPKARKWPKVVERQKSIRTQQNPSKSMQNAAERPQNYPERSFS